MLYFLLFLCFGITLGRHINPIDSRIINGQNATLGQFPWDVQVLLIYPGPDYVYCAGAIISDVWVLTSAHCLINPPLAAITSSGRVGRNDLGDVQFVENYTIHENFDSTTLRNDIAVLRTSFTMKFNDYMQPIALAEEELSPDTDVIVSGWGYSGNDTTAQGTVDFTETLQYITVTTLDNSDCEKIFGTDVVSANVVCAIGEDPVRNPCIGDGGAPLVINADTEPVHVGIFSFTSGGGCEEDYPAGYTRTAPYRDWIRATTGV